jgi:hypothetical protein
LVYALESAFERPEVGRHLRARLPPDSERDEQPADPMPFEIELDREGRPSDT